MKYIVSLLTLCFSTLIIWALLEKPISESSTFFLTDPWGIVSLADLYLGFFLFSLFIYINEKKVWTFTLWSLAVFILGNGVSALYIAIFLFQKKSISISN